MSCGTVIMRGAGDKYVSFKRIRDGIETLFARIGGCDVSTERVGRMEASLARTCGMTCRFALVCDTGYSERYLEIEPEIIWILDGWASNDVISNTTWHVA